MMLSEKNNNCDLIEVKNTQFYPIGAVTLRCKRQIYRKMETQSHRSKEAVIFKASSKTAGPPDKAMR